MTKRVLVVSLGRVLADQIRVEPDEACAVVAHVHAWLEASRDGDEAPATLPALDAFGITAFGDFEVRSSRVLVARQARPRAHITAELASLLLRLVSSGRTELEGGAAACAVVARRALRAAASDGDLFGDATMVTTPEALLDALAPMQPRDASSALALLFARWMRTTDEVHAPVWQAVVGDPVAPPPSAGVLTLQRADDADELPPRPVRRRRRTTRPTPRLAQRVGLGVGAALLIVAWGVATRGGEDATPPAPASRVATVTTDDVPTGTEVALTSGAAPRRVHARRVLHADITGRVPYSPSFDPQTRGLVFHAGLERTALLEAAIADDGHVAAVRTLREDGSRAFHAQVSPDGTQLAFDSDVDGTRGVYVAERDGTSARRVSGRGSASVPTWSPDGRTIAFARAEAQDSRVWNVWTVHLPSGALRRETRHRTGQAWGASWFPDGRRLAYSVEDALVVLDRDTGRTRRWPSPVKGRLVRTPAVSPDGRRIVFQVHRDGAWVLDLERNVSTRVLADRSAQEFAWAPDGTRIAYHSVRGGSWGIWIMDLES